jgi:tRNA G18 (ribose-2'-O)-methylase SpoU
MIKVSVDDPRIAGYRDIANPAALAAAGVFVAEGRLVVRRLLADSRFVTRSVLVNEAAFDALRDLLERSGTDVFVADQQTLNDIAGFNIHRGCLALAARPAWQSLADLRLDTATRIVVLEGVNNPDNVGGIFRSAAAFGADAVVLGPSCSDPLYRKSIRTSMAAALAVPFADAGAWPEALAVLRAHRFVVLALTPAANATAIEEVPQDFERLAILVGAEGEGVSAAAMAAADYRVRIPMSGPADSLNVTVAASIALYRFATPRAVR